MFPGKAETVADNPRIVQQLTQCANNPVSADTGIIQSLDPRLDGASLEAFFQRLGQRLSMERIDTRKPVDPGQARQIGLLSADEEPAVLGLIGLVQRAAAHRIDAPGLVPSLTVVKLHIGRLVNHGRVGQSRIYVLPLAGALTVQQGQGHAICSHEPSTVVVDRIGLGGGRPIAPQPAVHAGGGLGELFVTRPAGPGA